MSESPRIVHLAKYLPAFAGGMEAVTHELAQAGVAMGLPVAVVGVSPGETARQGYSLPGVEQIPLASHGRLGPVPLAPDFFRLASYLRPSDIVHVHLPNPLAEIALLSHLLRTPRARWPKIIPIAHVAIVRYPHLGSLWQVTVQRALLARSDLFIAASRQLVDSVPSFRREANKAVIIPFPTAAAPVRTRPEARDGPVHDGPVHDGPVHILAIGRLVGYKGFDVLIDALSQVPNAWRLTIVGEGPLAADLRSQVARHGLTDRVIFTGQIEEADKQRLLTDCDLLVAPSRSAAEAYGIVIAEAFAHGKPVVTTTLPTGVAYLARDGACGGVSTPGSAASLRATLLPLLADRGLRQSCGVDNLHFWKRELTRSRFMERYAAMVTPLLADHKWLDAQLPRHGT